MNNMSNNMNPTLTAAAKRDRMKRAGEFFRNRRKILGLSRADMAKRLGLTLGSHVSHVERGDARIAPDAVHNWAQALEFEPAQFSQHLATLYGPESAWQSAGESGRLSPDDEVALQRMRRELHGVRLVPAV